MMKKEINIFDYTEVIMKALKKGILLTTKADDKVNSMAISWGMLGIEWDLPIFTVLVRENRFTKEQIEKTHEFTLNIPIGEYDKKIIGFCGTKTGRDVDKATELGLTLIDSDEVKAPGIMQLPLTLECKVCYQQKQDKMAIPESIRKAMYPEDVDSTASGANKDYHIAYYGEIVKAYILE